MIKYAMMTTSSIASQAHEAADEPHRAPANSAASMSAKIAAQTSLPGREKVMTQQEYLRAAKEELGVLWDELADLAGIAPRALKTYRLPNESADHRGMPSLARRSIDQLLAEHRRKLARRRKN